MWKFRLNWSYSEVIEADDLEAAADAARATMQLLREGVELDGIERGSSFWLEAVDAEQRQGVTPTVSIPPFTGEG